MPPTFSHALGSYLMEKMESLKAQPVKMKANLFSPLLRAVSHV